MSKRKDYQMLPNDRGLEVLNSKVHIELFGKILEPDGTLTFLAALRIAEMNEQKQNEVISELIRNGIVDSAEGAWNMIANKACSDPKGKEGVCNPAPMSDDVLDYGTRYMTMNQYLMRYKDAEE